jgi:hypothetical protein
MAQGSKAKSPQFSQRFLLLSGDLPPVADGSIIIADFAALATDVLRGIAPDVVVTSLVTAQFDAFDVAASLAISGYRGRLCVIARALPAPDVIRDDIARIAPDLAVDLLVLP